MKPQIPKTDAEIKLAELESEVRSLNLGIEIERKRADGFKESLRLALELKDQYREQIQQLEGRLGLLRMKVSILLECGGFLPHTCLTVLREIEDIVGKPLIGPKNTEAQQRETHA